MKKSLLVILVLGLLGGGGYVGVKGFKTWRQARLVRQAHGFLAKSDLRNAALCAHKAVQFNPSHVETCRLMAELAELAFSPNAIYWRARVVELEPRVLENRLAWANTSLKLGDQMSANKALLSIDEQGQKTAAYHKATAVLASALSQLPEAEAHFAEAARLEPNNSVSQLNLAVVRMLCPDEKVAADARASLRQLSTNAVVRCDALRRLAYDAAHRQRVAEALSLTDQVLKEPCASFGDRVSRLAYLEAAKESAFSQELAAVQTLAETNPNEVFDLCKWLLDSGHFKEGAAWMRNLPESTWKMQPLPQIRAEFLAALKDWTEIDRQIEGQNWGELEFMRLAFKVRAAKGRGDDMAARAAWLKSLKLASQRAEQLSQLVRTTSAWGWPAEREDVLWALVESFPNEKWAFQTLGVWLRGNGRTRGLQKLFTKVLEIEPANISAKNNLTFVSLLLDSREKKFHELAGEVFRSAPDNAFFVSTYALSLFLQKKAPEALKLFSRLKSEELENPSVAAWYGIILAGNGSHEMAKKYLELAEHGPLLPEEKELLQRAKSRT